SDPAGAATSPPVDLLARGGGGYANGADRGVGETRGSTAPCPRDSESGTDSRGKDGSPHASDRARYRPAGPTEGVRPAHRSSRARRTRCARQLAGRDSWRGSLPRGVAAASRKPRPERPRPPRRSGARRGGAALEGVPLRFELTVRRFS